MKDHELRERVDNIERDLGKDREDLKYLLDWETYDGRKIPGVLSHFHTLRADLLALANALGYELVPDPPPLRPSPRWQRKKRTRRND